VARGAARRTRRAVSGSGAAARVLTAKGVGIGGGGGGGGGGNCGGGARCGAPWRAALTGAVGVPSVARDDGLEAGDDRRNGRGRRGRHPASVYLSGGTSR
jgi:hypothetical protein